MSGPAPAPDTKPGVPTANRRPPRALQDHCRVLADIAEPPNMKQAFDASLSVLLLQVGTCATPLGWLWVGGSARWCYAWVQAHGCRGGACP